MKYYSAHNYSECQASIPPTEEDKTLHGTWLIGKNTAKPAEATPFPITLSYLIPHLLSPRKYSSPKPFWLRAIFLDKIKLHKAKPDSSSY